MLLAVLCAALLPLASAVPLNSSSAQNASSSVPAVTLYWQYLNAGLVPISALDFGLIDQVLYYPVVPNQAGQLSLLNATWATDLVNAAHGKGKLAGFVLGGSQGSASFSRLVQNATLRLALSVNVVEAMTTYGFDSVQIDWEYPSSEADAQGLVDLLQQIRNLKLDARISLTLGYSGPGYPTAMAQIAQIVDSATIMAYDFLDPQTSLRTGAVAALNQCDGKASGANVKDSIKAWLDSGFPPQKLVLGVVAQAYNFSGVSHLQGGPTMLEQPFTAFATGQTYTDLRTMMSRGVLSTEAQRAMGGYERYWDDCTSTPYLYSHTDQRLIAYEDKDSITDKVTWAKQQGLAGVSMFSADADSSDFLLTGAARDALNDGADKRGAIAYLWLIVSLLFLAIAVMLLRKLIPRNGRKLRTTRSPSQSSSSSMKKPPVEEHELTPTAPDNHRFSTFTISSPRDEKRDTIYTISEEPLDGEEDAQAIVTIEEVVRVLPEEPETRKSVDLTQKV